MEAEFWLGPGCCHRPLGRPALSPGAAFRRWRGGRLAQGRSFSIPSGDPIASPCSVRLTGGWDAAPAPEPGGDRRRSALPPLPGGAQRRSKPGFHFFLCFSLSPLIGWKSKARLAPPARRSLPVRGAVLCRAMLCRHQHPSSRGRGAGRGAAGPSHPTCPSSGVTQGTESLWDVTPPPITKPGEGANEVSLTKDGRREMMVPSPAPLNHPPALCDIPVPSGTPLHPRGRHGPCCPLLSPSPLLPSFAHFWPLTPWLQ